MAGIKNYSCNGVFIASLLSASFSASVLVPPDTFVRDLMTGVMFSFIQLPSIECIWKWVQVHRFQRIKNAKGPKGRKNKKKQKTDSLICKLDHDRLQLTMEIPRFNRSLKKQTV